MRCGHDGQYIFAAAPQHDALGETIARDMACASAVRVDDILSSCGISSYRMFSVARYFWSLGAIDMT
jgi:hypothetical protein